MSSPRDFTIAIQVAYTGIDQEVVFENALPETIALTIRDNGKQLRQIKEAVKQCEYDLHPLLHDQEGSIELSAENFRAKLQDLLPGSTKIQKISPELFSTNYYRLVHKTVPVHVQTTIRIAPQHQLIDTPVALPDSIQIYGSKQAIDTITHINTSETYIDDLRGQMELTTSLELPAGIKASQDKVQIQCAAELFTEKSFTLPITVINVPENANVRLFPQVVSIVVRVGMSQFAQVEASQFTAYCEYPTIAADALDVQIRHNNPHITHIRIAPEKVEYMINRK